VSAAPIRCGAAVSLIGQTGQSDDTHSPDEWARTVLNRISPAALSISVVCTVAISCRPNDLRTISSPLERDAYRNVRSASRGNGDRIVAVSDFSGLVSSAWALARAAAIAPIESLDRCMAILPDEQLKGHRSDRRQRQPDARGATTERPAPINLRSDRPTQIWGNHEHSAGAQTSEKAKANQ
jgi:hypothetical protein